MIRIQGQIFDASGYASHCRGLFNALYSLRQDIILDVPLMQNWQRYVNDAELNAITKKSEVNEDTVIAISQPSFWPLILSNKPKKFYGFVVWEGEKIPKFWLDYLRDPRVDGILVPSKHVMDAITLTADNNDWIDPSIEGSQPTDTAFDELINKIHVIPHGVDLSLFTPQTKDSDKFTFLANKGWRGGYGDRGGIAQVLKAFNEEFEESEPVQLKLKINPAYIGPDFNIDNELNKLGLVPKKNIGFNKENIEFKQIPKFYRGDVFVTASKAEAFNIPCAEALAAGIPVISTNFGGQTDFINESNGWLVGGDLFEVKNDVFQEGNRWLEPNIADLRKAMRYVYEHRDEVKLKSEEALKSVQALSWRESAKKLLSIIK